MSIFAKKDFSYFQMFQIREGLEANLDVSQYAKPEVSREEMARIRSKLLEESFKAKLLKKSTLL